MEKLKTEGLVGILIAGQTQWHDLHTECEVAVVQRAAPNSAEPMIMIQIIDRAVEQEYLYRAAYVSGFRYRASRSTRLPETKLPTNSDTE